MSTPGKEPVVDANGDFVWRFRLEPGRHPPVIPDDAFAELFRSQLDEALKLIVLTWHGERVRVDGFRFLNDDQIYPIWSTTDDGPTQEPEDVLSPIKSYRAKSH